MRILFDVAIIGAGPGGTAAAIALARRGCRVALLERSSYDQVRCGEVLPPQGRLPLAELGVWDRFLEQGHAPSPAMISAWGDARSYETHFIFNPYGHGWHIDRPQFDGSLAVAAQEAGACVVRNARVTACQPGASSGWRVEYIGDEQCLGLQADFLVDATGRSSVMARSQRVKRISYDRLISVVSSLSSRPGTEPPDYRTIVEAVESGWWYTAQLPSSRMVLAYMTDADLLPKGRRQLRTYYRDRLDQAPQTRARADGCGDPGELRVVAANSSRLERITGGNWLALGDAAFAYDPLSSQGICRALRSGIHAADTVTRHRSGDEHALQQYESRSHRIFNAYLQKRAEYYDRETRWPQSAFWTRRQALSGGGLSDARPW